MNLLVWLDESFSLRLAQTLLHFLWQGTAIGIVVFALDQLLRRGSARQSYLLNVVAMFAMVSCLPVTMALVEVPSQTTENLLSSTEARRLELAPV